MGKKQARAECPAKAVNVVEDIIEFEDGGIYWREKKVGEKRYTITVAEQQAILQKLDDAAGLLTSELDRIERDDVPLAQGSEGAGQLDACRAIFLIRELRAIASHGGDCDALLVAYRLGRLAERMQVRPFEVHALRGRRTLKGAQNGASATNADHVELQEQYQTDIDRLMKYGALDGLSYNQAIAEVGRLTGASRATIARHTTNNWPRKGGRPRKPISPPPG